MDPSGFSEFPCSFGVQPPKDLSNLEYLETFETVEATMDLLGQLKNLRWLRNVSIDNIRTSYCAGLFAALSNMPLLSSLLLSARDANHELFFEALRPVSTKLQKIIIRGQWAPEALECPIFVVYGRFLKYLSLSSCHLSEDPLKMLAPHLPNITYLRLDNIIHSTKTLVLPAGSFLHLKTLVLKHMPCVNQLVIKAGALPCIDALYIVSLAGLDKVPQGLEFLPLKKLWMLNLHNDFRT
jgi:disease resistance protein RPM1